MKKIISSRSCCCLSLFQILVLLLSSQNGVIINENNVQTYLSPDCFSVYEYIDNNFAYFVSEYNRMVTDNNYFKASYIEKHFDILVNVDGSNQKGIFIDFDNSNGYALLIDNYEFLDFQIIGESPYYNIDLKYKHVYTNNNYYYIDENGEILSTDGETNFNENLTYKEPIYPGQDSEGCGAIIDIDSYFTSLYGTGYIIEKGCSVECNKVYSQSDLSCYLNFFDNGRKFYSEGNCWLVSAYNVLQLFKKHSDKMPSITETIEYKPNHEEFATYLKYFYGDGTHKYPLVGNNKYEYDLSHNCNFPKLYAEMRKYSLNTLNLDIEDGQSFYTSSYLVTSMARKYDLDIFSKSYLLWKAYAYILTKNLDDGYPLLFSTAFGTYGSHLMTVIGYRIYSKKRRIFLWFTTTERHLFFKLNDGWHNRYVYYDVSRDMNPIASLTEFNLKKENWWLKWIL